MAAVAPPPDSLDPPAATSEPDIASAPTSTSTPTAAQNPTSDPNTNPNPNPNPAPTPPVVAPPPPAPASFTASFRPLGALPPPVPQYGAVPNPSYPMAPGVQPPGVMPPGAVRPAAVYAPPPPGGYLPPGVPIPPPGLPRYPAPYPMIRPGFPPRPMPPVGVVPLQRPPVVPGIRGVPPMVTSVARPAVPIVTPAEKPQTTVYVGKIATVDNDFILSLLRLCGPVKSWKRAQDPSDGTLKGFGFCEFESAEGILRALRLLSKLVVDGQELVLNINQATREYLEKYVEKKTAREKAKETEAEGRDEDESIFETEKESSKVLPEETDKDKGDAREKDVQENIKKFGIVTDEDSAADKDATEKISNMVEERIKTKPPPPPPVQPADIPSKPQSELSSKHKNGESDADAEDKIEDDSTSEKKAINENEKPGTGSPDRRKSREKEKERREREKELERYERERERERVRREREKEHRLREAERLYRDRLKEWESLEREKEYQRQYDRDREKEKERERRREIAKQEDDSDDEDNRKRRRRSSSALEERKRRRLREKEEDLEDKLKEDEEIVEAKRRAAELQMRKEEEAAAAAAAAEAEVASAAKLAMQVDAESCMDVDTEDKTADEEGKKYRNKAIVADKDNTVIFTNGVNSNDGVHKNGDETSMVPGSVSDVKQNSNAPAKKLGFGLIGSGKRTSVPSVFVEEDDEDVDDKKMRPLVPIDYSTEELQAVQESSSAGPPNIVAAAEFAKRISVSNPKEERSESEKDRRRSSDRSNQRERDRNDEDGARVADERREKMHDREKDRQDKPKSENKKILDAKQLIDMIPKTKEELFAYDINWTIYDKHDLHERMKPWISKKIIEFLGEDEPFLVDYIVSCTKDHVQASKMLELLQSILDVEAEMFVLKMWRMLIFEIKKVETGLSGRPRA